MGTAQWANADVVQGSLRYLMLWPEDGEMEKEDILVGASCTIAARRARRK